MASQFVWLNRGKRSVTLDLKSDQGRTSSPGSSRRRTCSSRTWRPRPPNASASEPTPCTSVIPAWSLVGVTGYGSDGPYAAREAYDMLVQAETGLVSITGTAEAQAKTGIPTADIVARMYVVAGVPNRLRCRGEHAYRPVSHPGVGTAARRRGRAGRQVNDIAGLVAHPQLAERDRWRTRGTENGHVKALLPPMTYAVVELVMGRVPALGEHTDDVVREIGLTDSAPLRCATTG